MGGEWEGSASDYSHLLARGGANDTPLLLTFTDLTNAGGGVLPALVNVSLGIRGRGLIPNMGLVNIETDFRLILRGKIHFSL